MYVISIARPGTEDTKVITYKTLEDFKRGLKILIRDTLLGISSYGSFVHLDGYHFVGRSVKWIEIKFKFSDRYISAAESEYIYTVTESGGEPFELSVVIVNSDYDY